MNNMPAVYDRPTFVIFIDRSFCARHRSRHSDSCPQTHTNARTHNHAHIRIHTHTLALVHTHTQACKNNRSEASTGRPTHACIGLLHNISEILGLNLGLVLSVNGDLKWRGVKEVAVVNNLTPSIR